MRLAHLADLHLGYRQFDRLTAKGTNQREADVADAFRRTLDDVIAQHPDLILIAGDVFHSVRPTNAAILFLFKQLQRLREALPRSPVIMIAGNHDTPRSTETGTILKLYEALGVEVVVDAARRIMVGDDCAVLAVPHQALIQAERPALRPDRGVPKNILLLHAEIEGIFGDLSFGEYGGAVVTRADIGFAQWNYVALGHYHVAKEIAENGWYAGATEYTSTNPWGELRDQAASTIAGKGYLLVEIDRLRVEHRPIAAARHFIDLPPVEGAGMSAKEIDAAIAQRVAGARPAIDDQVVRLVAYDVPRGTARALDHAAVRGFKARALSFNLDVRRPEARVATAPGAGAKRRTLPETVRDFLGRRPLDAELPREEFVRLGVEYVEHAGGGEDAR